MDVIIQVQNQTHVHRLCLYNRDRSLNVFIDGLGDEAIEVGPCSNITGPGLLLLKRVTLTPVEVLDWLAKSCIEWVVTRVFWLGPLEAATEEDLIAQLTAMGPPPGQVRLQIYPRAKEFALGSLLPEEWELHPVEYQHVLHAVEMEGRWRYHLAPAEGQFQNAHERDKRVPGQVCKAACKLAEALAATGFEPKTGNAIDIGAAPGGWTALLAQRMARVAAIDPAELDPAVLALPNVTHLRCRAEDAAPGLAAALGGEGVDLLVCDMNAHPAECVPIVRTLLPELRPGGLLVLTLKFFGRGRDKARWDDNMRRELGPEFAEGLKLIWLLANTNSERTCVAVRAAAPAPAAAAPVT